MEGNGPGGAPLTNDSMLGTVVLELPTEGLGGGLGLTNGREGGGGGGACLYIPGLGVPGI